MMAALARWRMMFAVVVAIALCEPVLGETSGPQASRVPRDIVLVLDNSGSMRKNDRNFTMKRAAGDFIKAASPNSHVGIIVFDSNVKYAFHLAPASGQTQSAMLDSLQQLDYRGRWTNIPAALNQAVDELKANGREGTTKHIVLLTDGVVETGDATADKAATDGLRQHLVDDAKGHQIKVYSVALGPRSDTDLLQVLANRTSGEYFWAATGDDLSRTFEQIGLDISKSTVAVGDGRPPQVDGEANDGASKVVTLSPTHLPADEAVVQGTQDAIAPTSIPTAAPTAEVATVAPTAIPLKKSAEPTTGVRQQPPADVDTPAATIDAVEEVRPPKPRVGGSNRQKTGGTDWWLDGLGGLLILTLGLLGYMIYRSRNNILQGPEGMVPASRLSGNDAAHSPQAYLHDLSGVTGRQRHEIGNAITLIGRVAPNPEDRLGSIVIDRPTIGRRHAVIERKHYGFWLIDQHSKNGTYVNEYRVTDEVCLTHGDRVRFHEYDFEFVLAGLGLADETISVGELILLNNKGPEARSATVRSAHQVDITSPDDPSTASGRVKSGSNKGA